MGAGILVLPIGRIETSVLEHICAALQETFGRECRLGEVLPKPNYAIDPRRRQYSAQKILQRLRRVGAERVLGVVDLDLYVPQLNYVFGLADPLGWRAVIAIPRLRQELYGLPEDRGLFFQRVAIELHAQELLS
jgi:archaemetzincin